MNDRIEAHRRQAILLIGIVVLGWALLGAILGLLVGRVVAAALIGAIVGLVYAAVGHRIGPRMWLRFHRAIPGDPEEMPRVYNLTEGLSLTAGITMPSIHVVEDPSLNGFAVARGSRDGAIAITTGLLDRLDRIQLEAVIAHLVVRLRNSDASLATLTATLIGGPIAIADLAVRSRSGEVRRAPLALLGTVPFALTPFVAPLVRRMMSPDRIILADLDACRLTRYPPGLDAALSVIEAESAVTAVAGAAGAHLWFAGPTGGVADRDLIGRIHRRFDSYPPLDQRIALVREL